MLLTLLVVLAHSLFRLAITPPWGFSDEEGHFEVVEYLARHWQWPTLATTDLALRQEISDASSGSHCPPSEPWSGTCIGVNQYEELPLFYLLQAVVQTALPLPELLQRLYLARLVSLGLSLITAGLAFQLALEVWKGRWMPAVLVVLVMATNFSYVGAMLAVNNDTLAVFSVTFLAWATVRLFKRGWSLAALLLWGAAIGVCLLTKSSTLIATGLSVVLIGIQFSLTWLSPAQIAVGLAAAGLVGGFAVTTWNGLPGWNAIAGTNPSSPAGSRVLLESPPDSIFQGLPVSSVESLRDQEVTLEAWVYAPRKTVAHMAILVFPEAGFDVEQEIRPGEWSRLVLSTHIPATAQYVDVVLTSTPGAATQWDGISLTDASQARQWLFDGDGEIIAPLFTGRVGEIFIAGRSLNERLILIYDFPRSVYYYPLEGRYLFSTFWGGWGWNHVSLSRPVIALYAAFTGLGGLGCLAWGFNLYRRRTRAATLTLIAAVWLAALAAAIVAQSMLRVDYPLATYPFTFYASARYAFPMVAPFAILSVAGLQQIGAALGRPRWVHRLMAAAAVAAFLVGIHATLTVHIPSFRESPRIMNPAYFPY